MANFLAIFVVSLFSMCMAKPSKHHHHVGVPDAVEYFGVQETINITWAHAVNSIEKLQDALAGDQMMLEADIVIGRINDHTDDIPIMAHPPDSTSDISFESFLTTVIDAVNNETAKKGIKLDFKQIEAVEPGLKILKEHQKEIHFPVWLNADILQGPVNSTKSPVNAKKFLSLTQLYFPRAKLSLGWTTRYGKDSSMLDNTSDVQEITSGKYEISQIERMIDLLDGMDLKTRPTFAVRAGLAEDSTDVLLTLLVHGPITIWSSKGDRVNMEKLQTLVNALGKNNVYMDVPFNLYAEPLIPHKILDNHHKHNSSDHNPTNTDGKNNTIDNNIVPSAPGSAMSVVNNNLHVIVFLVSLFLINQFLFN